MDKKTKHPHTKRAAERKYRLDGQGNSRKLAVAALNRYGDPTMSLSELHDRIAQTLGDASLSQFIIDERKVGW